MIKSLAEQVYDQVVKMIQEGELKEGDKVGEVFLVEKIGISRTPIREALIQLASDNILENIPRKGFYVKGIDKDIQDKVYALVALLDCHAAELAWDKIDASVIKTLEECIEKMDLAINLRTYMIYEEWQKKFHAVYRKLSGNEAIDETIEFLLKKIISSSYLLDEEDSLYSALELYNNEHRKLVEYMKQNNLEAFKEQLSRHWTGELEDKK